MESCLQLPVTRGALLFFSEFMGINVNPGLIKSEAVELVANFSSRWSHVYAKLPSFQSQSCHLFMPLSGVRSSIALL